MVEPSQLCLKFLPTDEQIIQNYVFKKANGLDVVDPYIIDDCDIYGDEQIWMNKFLETNKTEIFFFSKLRKISDTGVRIVRVALNGTWKESHSKKIKSQDQIIGSKHFFNFVPKKGFYVEERWLMNEFRIAGDLISMVQDASYVVCRISRKKPMRSRRIEEKQNPIPLMVSEPVPLMLSFQNYNESVDQATMQQTKTTETTGQGGTGIDCSVFADITNDLLLSPGDLEFSFSSPKTSFF